MSSHKPSGSSRNEKALTDGQSARKFNFRDSKSQPQAVINDKDYEHRRNAAASFRNPLKTEDWHAAYRGVMVIEGLRDGDKCWVNVYIRTSRKNEKYLTIILKKQGE
jgi:hypothetical protein